MAHSLEDMRRRLYVAVVCDALDSLGFRRQSPDVQLATRTLPDHLLVGRCKTTLWTEMAYDDPCPYELELQTVDECQPDDVIIAAAGGSTRSGIWGELLSTAARNSGCVGAIVDGAIRDVSKMAALQFPVYARATCPYDSLHRQRVIEVDVPVQFGGVRFCPGDLVMADPDGVVVVPKDVENDALRLAWEKVAGENLARDAIREGMKATDAYRKFGVL